MKIEDIVKKKMLEMFARRLDYAPKDADGVIASTSVMAADLRRLGLKDDDDARIGEAFDALGSKTQRWPTPIMVKENLPPRKHYQIEDKSQPVPPEVARKRLAELRKLIGTMTTKGKAG